MKSFIVYRHIDSNISVEIEAENEEQALEIGGKMLEDISDEEFTRQVIENAQADDSPECYEN